MENEKSRMENLEETGNVLTEEGWDQVIRSLDFLPDDYEVRNNYMKGLVIALCTS